MLKIDKTAIKQILLIGALVVGMPDASANGFMDSSSREKSGGVVLDNADGLQLDREQLKIRLLGDGYQASVRYEVTAATPYRGKLFFPMICSSLETSQCIKSVTIKVDGQAVTASKNETAEVARLLGEEYLSVAWEQLTKHGYNSMVTFDQPPDVNLKELLKVMVIAAPVVTRDRKFILDITYEAPYVSSNGGTTKSAIYSYSDDIVYYDFTPAGRWAKNRVKSLEVSIEENGIGYELLNHGGWKLQRDDKGYSAKLENVAMAELEPLIFGIDQTNRYRYRDFQRSLDYKLQGQWKGFTLRSNDAIKSKDGRYDAGRAADGDFTTAWCSNVEKPVITITLPQSGGRGCGFEGVAFLNGYTKSRKIWLANNRIRSFALKLTGANHSGGTRVKTSTETITDGPATYADNPYQMLRFVPLDTYYPVNANTVSPMDEGEGMTIELEILDVYKGASYNDTCISELMPVYNCG